MSPQAARAAVVVAVDDAGTAADPVEWASAEAAARYCPLRIVHAFHPPLPDHYCIAAATSNLLTEHTTAEVVLRKAADRAHSVASDIEVTTRSLNGWRLARRGVGRWVSPVPAHAPRQHALEATAAATTASVDRPLH